MVDKRTPRVYVEFEAKFGELWATRTLRETWWAREQFTFMWNLRQNLESSGHQEKSKVTLRYGTGVALTLSAVQVDILSHRCCVCVDTKRDHGGQENTSRFCGI